MKNLFNQANQLVTTNKVKVTLGERICKINISGYSLDKGSTKQYKN